MAVSWNDVAVRAWPGKEQEQHRLPREVLNRRCGDAACGDVSNVPRLPGNQGCHPIPNLPAHTGTLSLPCFLVPGHPCRHLPCFPLSQCLDHFGSSFQRGLGKQQSKGSIHGDRAAAVCSSSTPAQGWGINQNLSTECSSLPVTGHEGHGGCHSSSAPAPSALRRVIAHFKV